MAVVYFDASAFVKLVIEEEGSDLAADLWDGCDLAVSSRLVHPEVRAALAAAQRNRTLTAVQLQQATVQWHAYWEAVRPIELTEAVELDAATLVGAHRLRGADGIHLASARIFKDVDLILAVWDRRLHAGARAAGLTVAPAILSPPGR